VESRRQKAESRKQKAESNPLPEREARRVVLVGNKLMRLLQRGCKICFE